jgi:hypothetical protein
MPESTKPKPFCFVLMPFAETFTDIYNLGIKETCEQAGAYCERVDEQVYQGNILDRVYNQIAKADFIIADMTGKNANVFYEVGYAHAIGKSTILLTQHNDDIPFDLKHFPHVVYNNITALKAELKKWVEWNIQNPKIKIENKLSIEIYCKDRNLSAESVYIDKKYATDYYQCALPLTIHNNSTETFHSNDFKIACIFSEKFQAGFFLNNTGEIPYVKNEMGTVKPARTTALPDGNQSINFPPFETLYPYDYAPCLLYLKYNSTAAVEKVIIRLYTSFGTRDYTCFLDFP